MAEEILFEDRGVLGAEGRAASVPRMVLASVVSVALFLASTLAFVLNSNYLQYSGGSMDSVVMVNQVPTTGWNYLANLVLSIPSMLLLLFAAALFVIWYLMTLELAGKPMQVRISQISFEEVNSNLPAFVKKRRLTKNVVLPWPEIESIEVQTGSSSGPIQSGGRIFGSVSVNFPVAVISTASEEFQYLFKGGDERADQFLTAVQKTGFSSKAKDLRSGAPSLEINV